MFLQRVNQLQGANKTIFILVFLIKNLKEIHKPKGNIRFNNRRICK